MCGDKAPAYFLDRLHRFMRLNPDFWPSLKAKAEQQAKSTGYICVRQIMDELRRERFIKPEGQEYRVCNEMEPVLARLLLIACPQYATALPVRRSRFDGLVTAELIDEWGISSEQVATDAAD